MRVIGSIATMPARSQTFALALQSILPQVDTLYVFLDGFQSVPPFLQENPKCVATLLPNERNLHASSRFLAPRLFGAEAMVALLDDDILYPPDYIARLRAGLERYGREAIVGFHAALFLPPHRSFVRDRSVLHGTIELTRDQHVHQLGCGTAAFLNAVFHPDPAHWRHHHMDDLYMAAEAIKAGLSLVSLSRPAGWLQFLEENQDDSLWRRTHQDDRLHAYFMRDILTQLAQTTWHDWWRPV